MGSSLRSNERRVFVAYPYGLHPRDEYRALFKSLERLFDVDFSFADERITSLHILRKIEDSIRSSTFGIYDITGWNANVTLELGLALGLTQKVYIAINPGTGSRGEAPSDLRGIDRIQFSCLGELRRNLHALLQEHFGIKGRLLKASDLLWSPRGQPKPTPLIYTAAFRDILVQLVPDPHRSEQMIVDLSLRVESRAWRSIDYDNAPWVHMDFLDSRFEQIEVAGSRNWVVVEFRPNESRHVYEQKTLVSDRWPEVAAVNVWAGAGYALSTSWYRNWSPYMIPARLRQVVARSRRRLTSL